VLLFAPKPRASHNHPMMMRFNFIILIQEQSQ